MISELRVSCTFFFSLQISEHSISRIPVSAHEKNMHEQNVCPLWYAFVNLLSVFADFV